MSSIKVDSITDAAGTGAPAFPNGLTGDGSALTGIASVGVGQTWQEMLPSRTGNNTAYQNTTGKPICVYIEDNVNTTFSVSTDNTTWLAWPIVNSFQPLSVVIPDNNYYRVSAAGAPLKWLELR